MMKAIWHRVACLSMFALACGGEDADDGTDLKQQWLESAPLQYVAKACSTGFTVRTCSISAVDAGVPVAMRQQEPFSEDWQDVAEPRDVIAGILNRASGEADKGCKLRVTPHETYAFPESVFESCEGEGYGVEISCFVPDTLDLSLCEN